MREDGTSEETKVLCLTDKAVMSFLASLAQAIREIDTSRRNAAKLEVDLGTLFYGRLRELVLTSLHKGLKDHDLKAMQNMIVTLDAMIKRDKPLLNPMSSTPH